MTIRLDFEEHQRVLTDAAAHLPERLEAASRLLAACLRGGNKALAVGNGGSAADAQHFASELVGRFSSDRPGYPAIALTTDSSALTAIANDYGYARVFSRQVEAHARPGDLLIAISTSGTSENILAAATAAKARGTSVVALTGRGGGKLAALADVLLDVPSSETQRIQEIHSLCLHALVRSVEAALATT